MDNKELKELMEFIAQSTFAEFEMEREGFKLKLVKDVARMQPAAPQNHPAAPALTQAAVPQPSAAPVAAPAPAAGTDLYQVTSPMVGTFYRSPNPSAPPFLEVGDIVKKGQVICIIEVMKLMNEIESEVAGEVIDIPVSNGQPVEYAEVLFRIRVTSS